MWMGHAGVVPGVVPCSDCMEGGLIVGAGSAVELSVVEGKGLLSATQ